MLWPILTFAVLTAALALHLWWRARYARAQTQARHALEALRQSAAQRELESQAQQDTVFNSMVEGLLLLDETGRVQLANRACASLLDLPGDVRGKTLMEAVRLHELGDLVASLATRQQVLGYELKLSRPDESWLEVNAAAIFNAANQWQGTILVFHDLTRLKKLERVREEFVANVSHELRTPLSLIKGYAETLLDGAKDNPEVATKFLQTIDRNAERLKMLIEDLLTISQLESGRLRLNPQAVQLLPAIEKVLNDFKPQAAARKMQLVNAAPDWRLRADPDRLEQVLGNLVDNAIKYGHVEGRVTVTAQAAENDFVELQVRDDGPGLPAEALERVFERFYRVDKARSREQGGTGLGLAIVKHIVQSHSGKVWAVSQPGCGATFCFTLPQDTGGL